MSVDDYIDEQASALYDQLTKQGYLPHEIALVGYVILERNLHALRKYSKIDPDRTNALLKEAQDLLHDMRG